MTRVLKLAVVIGVAFPTALFAQYPFGKNKVIYTNKQWKVLQTEHVDIYYYPSEENLVRFAAPLVEDTYLEYGELFRLEFRDRLPLVFYSSHYDFQQTNIIPSLISEFTGGFTDLIKGRVAVPFTGSMWEFRHVIRHELVHAFMLEKMRVVMNARQKYTYASPPLWFVEGMAEYIASPAADTRSHMFIRDALINGQLPDLRNIWRIEGSFLMYKQGEAVVRFIANNYGKEAIIKILENWWISEKFPHVLKKTLNLDLDELNEAFMKSIKRRYYPALLYGSFAPDIGKQLTRPRSFHSRPTVGVRPNGEYVVYALCAQDGVVNICSLEKNKEGRIVEKTLIEGGRSSVFESLPAFRSKLEARGDTLVFVSKRQERDAVYLWDAAGRRTIQYFTFSGLDVLSSPSLSPDGTRFVFGAIDSTGLQDLYLFDMREKRLDRLTHDAYSEEDPDFHPSREVILFSSDRCHKGERENSGIYSMNLPTREITALTCGDYSDGHPDWSPDGSSFLFTSDRDGTYDIYLYRDRLVYRQTNVVGGMTTPVFLPDRSGFIASGYYKGEFQLYDLPIKWGSVTSEIIVAGADTVQSRWRIGESSNVEYKTVEYKTKLGLDFAGTGLAIDPDFGQVGNGGEIVLTDILGNHQYYVFFGNASEGFDDFWKRLNLGVNYVNLSHRLNYSLGAFHLTSFVGDYFSIYRFERRYGVATGLSYPFSKFARIDGTVVVRAVERENDFALGNERSILGTTFATYVVDNTLWTVGGPLKGTRYYMTVGHTFDFRGRGFESTTLHWDIRKYFKLTDRIVLAERFLNRNSWGSDLQIFYLGGPWDLRGYDFREFFGRSVLLLNSEIRFPLIERFSLSFPFGTLETPSMRGAVFFDMGKVTRFIADTDWLGSMGAGIELNLGYAPVIRVNFTRATDFSSISKSTELELFIGYNY